MNEISDMCTARYYVGDYYAVCQIKEHSPGELHKIEIQWAGDDGHAPSREELNLLMAAFGTVIAIPEGTATAIPNPQVNEED
jgi:hypothetical protein